MGSVFLRVGFAPEPGVVGLDLRSDLAELVLGLSAKQERPETTGKRKLTEQFHGAIVGTTIDWSLHSNKRKRIMGHG